MTFTKTKNIAYRALREMRLFVPSTHKLRALIVIESTDRVICFEMQAGYFSSSLIRMQQTDCIDIPEPLDFMARSSGWQFLNSRLAVDYMDNATLVLHPDLYLLQNTDTNHIQPNGVNLTPISQNQLTICSLVIDRSSLVYSCHKEITKRYPYCSSIVPWSEIVRMLAQKMKITSPWLIANNQYIWIMDNKGQLHECAAGAGDYLDWLVNILSPEHAFVNNCTCLVDSAITEQHLLELNFNSVTINSRLESITSILRFLLF